METRGRKPARKLRRSRRWIVRACLGLAFGAAAVTAYYALDDRPVTYSSVERHFKYGSTGSERLLGIPMPVWLALPEMFPEYLPGSGYASLGFIYESGESLPIGISQRSLHGIRRVGLNCGACHVGVVRDAADNPPRALVGMPANTLDLGAFGRFLFRCATDARFTPQQILAAIDRMGIALGPIERLRLRYREIYLLREGLLMLRQHFEYADVQPAVGPGRIDAATALKSFFAIGLGQPYQRPVGTVDFPSVWQLAARDGMSLHWDGNNPSSSERLWLGAVHSGAAGAAADGGAIERMQMWLGTEKPPSYPLRNPSTERLERGRSLYEERCAQCHGKSGTVLEGARAGQVTPLAVIRTDSNAARTLTEELVGRLNTLRVADRPPLSQFRKAEPVGYANVPLDGIWLRAPYLHNGSVPTVRDLLEPERNRPKVFYRGNDLLDDQRLGFVSNVPEAGGRRFFAYYTGLAGNSNSGHDGAAFSTDLPPQDKDAIVEYLKTF